MQKLDKDDIIRLPRDGAGKGRPHFNLNFLNDEGGLHMTAIAVFAALIVANVAYSIYDNRRIEAARQMDDFMRVEYKKTYAVNNKTEAVQGWY